MKKPVFHTKCRSLLVAALIACSGVAPVAIAQVAPTSAQAWKRDDPVLNRAILDLVIANRILAHEGVVDAYGHISMRHPTNPNRFLLARSRSPELVEPADILEFNNDGTPVDLKGKHPYVERFIHAGIYKSRPEVNAVVHSHADQVLPYTISSTPLQAVIHSAGVIGNHIPVWDIRARFGDTNLLVVNIDQGNDIARVLAKDSIVLMRGHGFAAAGRNLVEVLRMSIYLRLNATVLTEASRLGKVEPLSKGEIAKITDIAPNAPELRRAWEYWATRAGVTDLLAAP
jgi:ribulose-5-phosphate 4-epimerase/fuculose-1-phosphate aldolase